MGADGGVPPVITIVLGPLEQDALFAVTEILPITEPKVTVMLVVEL